MNQQTFNNIFSIALIVVLVASVGIFYYANKETLACSNNPAKYLISKMQNQDTGKAQCTCYFSNPKYNPVYFDENNVTSSPLIENYINEKG